MVALMNMQEFDSRSDSAILPEHDGQQLASLEHKDKVSVWNLNRIGVASTIKTASLILKQQF
jgi:hypothetical protein